MRHGRTYEDMTIVTVVETPEFQRRSRALMSEEERLELIDFIARDGGGKSGGYRVIHFYCEEDSVPIFLITVFAKNEKANLTKAETEIVKSLGKMLADSYRSQP